MQAEPNLPFLIHACCVPVKGFTKSVIYDLNRCRFDNIPNDLYNVLSKWEGNTMENIKKRFGPEDNEVLEEYFDFLIEKEYIFFCEHKEEVQYFPKIDPGFEYPAILSNSILQFDRAPDYDLHSVIIQLNALGCRDIQLAFCQPLKPEVVNGILTEFQTSSFKSIEVLIPFSDFTSEETLNTYSERHKRLSRIYVFTSPYPRTLTSKNRLTDIIFSQSLIPKNMYHPVNSTALFRVSPELFLESLNFNPYLNGKMFIDSSGNIKNAPNSEIIFGNVRDSKLNTIATSQDFTALWKTKKDDIRVCKDCEYRYMCTDCRIPEINENRWEHRLSCGYDVYTGRWGAE